MEGGADLRRVGVTQTLAAQAEGRRGVEADTEEKGQDKHGSTQQNLRVKTEIKLIHRYLPVGVPLQEKWTNWKVKTRRACEGLSTLCQINPTQGCKAYNSLNLL